VDGIDGMEMDGKAAHGAEPQPVPMSVSQPR
jgi:hypothetical protein